MGSIEDGEADLLPGSWALDLKGCFSTRRKQAIYLFLLPIVFPLWLTVPDVRRLVGLPSCPQVAYP